MDADVIVVGAGNAGMSAAFAAREQGASVLVLEKAARVVGRELGVHGGRHAARARRARRRA